MTTYTDFRPQSTDEYTDPDVSPVSKNVVSWADDPTDAPKTYGLIDPGTYSATIVGVPEWSYTQNGDPAVQLTLRLHGEGVEGRRVWNTFYLTKKAKFILKNFLWTAGFSAEYLAQTEQPLETLMGDLEKSLPDMDVTAVVYTDTYNPDKPKSKVRKMWAHVQEGYPPRVAPPQAVEPDDDVPFDVPTDPVVRSAGALSHR